jgi:hypothetical protein
MCSVETDAHVAPVRLGDWSPKERDDVVDRFK